MTTEENEITLQHLLGEILDSKKYLGKAIATSESRISSGFKELQKKIDEVENENKFLKNKIEHLEKQLKKTI